MKRIEAMAALMCLLAVPAIAQVKVAKTVTRTVAVFDVTSSNRSAKVTGIYLDNNLATCKAQDNDTLPQPVDVDSNTVKTLSSPHWIVTCTRKLQDFGGTIVSPPFDISFSTTTGPIIMSVPAESLLPYSTASQLQQQIAAVQGRLQKIRVSTTQAGNPNGTPPDCPTGFYDASGVVANTWPGGQGYKHRICIQVGE